MKQKEFLIELNDNKGWQHRIQKAVERNADTGFYFTLGEIFGELKINGWESETFIDKVAKICNVEW